MSTSKPKISGKDTEEVMESSLINNQLSTNVLFAANEFSKSPIFHDLLRNGNASM